MDFSSILPATYLIPDWMTRLLDESYEEAENHRAYPVKLLNKTGRDVVWNMCADFGFDKYGVPGQACRLLERYLSFVYRDYASHLNTQQLLQYKLKLMLKIPLLVATCIQLAAKMNNSGAQINATVIRVKLLCKGISHDIEEINATEYSVFDILDFRIPSWTSVEAGHLLSLEIGLPSEYLEDVAEMINYTEYKRDYVESEVRRRTVNKLSLAYTTGIVRTLHLTAGAVVATTRLLNVNSCGASFQLAEITRAPLPYINCISVVICKILINEMNNIQEINTRTGRSTAVKRKLEP